MFAYNHFEMFQQTAMHSASRVRTCSENMFPLRDTSDTFNFALLLVLVADSQMAGSTASLVS